MKKQFLWLLLFLPACSVTKNNVVSSGPADQAVQVAPYAPPLKVFGIGVWSDQYMILTLRDANNKYVIVKARRDTTLKIGTVYNTK